MTARAVLQSVVTSMTELSYSLLCDNQSCLTIHSVSSAVLQSVLWQSELSYSLFCDTQICLTIYSLSSAVLQYHPSMLCDSQSCLTASCVTVKAVLQSVV